MKRVTALPVAAATLAPQHVLAGGNNALCCQTLATHELLASQVVMPNTTLYDARLDSYFSASAALPPTCMVLPRDTADVAAVMETVSAHECLFGMRSGGHSQWAGASSVDEGVTIDLGYMNTTTYDNATTLASIQPGAHWSSVYDTLKDHGVIVTGGRADIVGVGGFIMGGGYSFYLGRKGWACDTIVNFEVVLANGTVVDANADEHADLFRGLKGTSGNLGIVTRFDMEALTSEAIWGGAVEYDMSQKDAVFQAYIDLAESMVDQEESQVILHLPYVDGEFGLRTIQSNSADVGDAPEFAELHAIANTSSTAASRTVANLTAELSGVQPQGVWADWWAAMYKNDVRILDFVHAKHAEYIEKFHAALSPDAGLETMCQFQPVASSLVDKSVAAGGNMLGLEDVVDEGPGAMWLLTLQVVNPEDEALAIPIAQEFVAEVDAYADSIGANMNWTYLNYAWKDQDPLAGYGQKSVQQVREIASVYDPDSVFQKLRRSGFKIPTA